ncbi:DnaD domain-containing protein [Lachnoclostridium sp. Marseille-P6806]|uniref:DnaD domain-containing protein n=1 Tax=Lachnoclostridium sp. Marseille-P6806 TaxID=2364793 RepID=UPI001030C422|nr:DnaD domain protein [Lachnoclostridium sp. Marseille-P6806]
MLTIYSKNRMDSTLVSNLFIDEYMTDANDAQLKVYLYLLRCMASGKATSISDMADRFNHTEKDILRALRYWESKGLLSLAFDSARNLTGICMNTPGESTEDGAARTGMPGRCVISMAPVLAGVLGGERSARGPADRSVSPAAPSTPESASSASRDIAGDTGLPLPDASAAVPARTARTRSAAALEAFRADQKRRELLFVIEQYVGKPLAVNEIRTVAYIAEELHFSNDLIDFLFQYCVDRGKKDFRYVEKVAVNWAEKGITTPGQALEESAGKNRRSGKTSFAQFRQNQYDFNELSNILDN